MISSYLKELVQANDRVIIPGFGAFLKRDKGTGLLADSLTFSPFLRFNDELLQNFVATKDGIQPQEALERIEQMVADIVVTIDRADPYYMPGLGYFYKDQRGGVQFAYDAGLAPEPVRIPAAPATLSVGAVPPTSEPQAPAVAPRRATKTGKTTAKKTTTAKAATAKDATSPKPKPKTKTPGKTSTKATSSSNIVATSTAAAAQLEQATHSLQQWIEQNEKRKTKPVPPVEDAAEPRVTATHSTTTDTIFDEPLVTNMVAHHTSEAESTLTSPSSVVVPTRPAEVVPTAPLDPQVRRNTGTRSGFPWHLLVLGVAIVVIVLGSLGLWFWQDVEDWMAHVWQTEAEVAPEQATPTTASVAPFVPKVYSQQQGVVYLSVAQFQQFDYAQDYARLLYRNAEAIPDLVMLKNGMYAVCVARATQPAQLEARYQDFKQRHPATKIIK